MCLGPTRAALFASWRSPPAEKCPWLGAAGMGGRRGDGVHKNEDGTGPAHEFCQPAALGSCLLSSCLQRQPLSVCQLLLTGVWLSRCAIAGTWKYLKIQSFTSALSIQSLSHQQLQVVNIDLLLPVLFTCWEGNIRMGLTGLLRRQNQNGKLLVVKNCISPVDFLHMHTTKMKLFSQTYVYL